MATNSRINYDPLSLINPNQIVSRASTILHDIPENGMGPIDDPGWLTCEDFWISTAEQGSDEWLEARKGNKHPKGYISPKVRVTASNFGSCCSKGYDSPNKLARKILGIEEHKFSEYSLRIMQRGTDLEPVARDWYIRETGNEVIERGLAVPKWNPYIGASTDGDVIGEDGIIEIKCPVRMYDPLVVHMSQLKHGWKSAPGYHGHVKDAHYFQMQGNLAILGKKWCDYVVYSPSDDKVFMERIPFNEEYWRTFIYPKLCTFVKTRLLPHVK